VIQSTNLTTQRGRFAALRWESPGTRHPLLVLLHGFPDHPPNFAPLAEALVARGFTVVAPWLRGYSPSPCTGDFTIEGLTSDVIAIIKSLGAAPVILVGHDWGAVLTYTTCAVAPELILHATAMSVPHPLAFVASLAGSQLLRSWYMAAFQLPGAAVATKLHDFAAVHWLWQRWSLGFSLPAQKRLALEQTLSASWPAPLQYYRSVLRPLSTARSRWHGPLSAAITVPTLYLHGVDDGCIAPLRASQVQYFSASLRQKLMSGVGHFLPHEVPDRCAEEILIWHQANV
jgi:pimeloyl-ACP methyl ester carboxylesterase